MPNEKSQLISGRRFSDIDPSSYTKLFNLNASVLHTYVEVFERTRMHLDKLPSVELFYLYGQWYFNKADIRNYRFSDKKINMIIDKIIERGERYLKFTEKVSQQRSKIQQADLINIFRKFLFEYGRYMRIVDVPVYVANHFEDEINNLLKKHSLGEKEFNILTHPLYNTFHNRRHKDLILLKIGKLSRDKFRNFWAWSNMVILQYKEIDDEYIDQQLDLIGDAEAELARLDQDHKNAQKQFDDLCRILPKVLQQKAKLIQKLIRIRDYRFELLVRGNYNMYPVLSKLAQNIGIEYSDMIYMRPDEIINRNIPSDLQERKKGYAYIGDTILVKEKAKEIFTLFNKQSHDKTVKGKGVSTGKIKGTAKIVLRVEELNKINKGDVIVCEITTPDYLHALSKVSAIVANIGGFTSHSAIVAREFGIPCVVGTGNATLVFKDGDVVEVDANIGTVALIERAVKSKTGRFTKPYVIKEMSEDDFRTMTLKLKEEIWWTEEAPASVQTLFYPMRCFISQNDDISPRSLNIVVEGLKDRIFIERTLNREKIDQYRILYERFKNDPDYLDHCKQDVKDHSVLLLESVRKFEANKNKFTNVQLWKHYKKFIDLYVRWLEYPAAIECIDSYTSLELEKDIRKEHPDLSTAEINDMVFVLSAPRKVSFMEQERIRVLTICVQYYNEIRDRKFSKKIQLQLHQLAQDYSQLKTNYKDSKFQTAEDFKSQVIEETRKSKDALIKEIENLKQKIPRLIKKKDQMIKNYRLSEDLQRHFDMIESMGESIDNRKYFMMKITNYIHLFCEEFSRRFDLHVQDVKDYTMEDLENLLVNGKIVPLAFLNERRKCSVYVVQRNEDGTIHDQWVYGERANALLEATDPEKGIIQGQIASAPVKSFTGKAQVVLNVNETNFIEGNILVTTMTRPEFIPIMRKASAVVTDEGGVTCHAAIVSREMGIPCIIGTKVATKTIADGDTIELDLEQGTVRQVREETGTKQVRDLFSREWEIYGGNAAPLYVIPAGDSGLELKSLLDIEYNAILYHFKKDYAEMFYDTGALKTAWSKLERRYQKNPDYFVKIRKDYERTLADQIPFLEEMFSADLSNYDTDEFLSRFKRVIRYMRDAVGVGHIIEAFSMVNADILRSYLNKTGHDTKTINKAIEVLSQPVSMSWSGENEENLVKISKAPKKDQEKLLEKHAESYYWIKNNYLHGQPLKVDDFRKDMEQIDPHKLDYTRIKQEKQDLIEKFGLGKEAVDFIRLIEFFAQFHDFRKMHILKSLHFVERFTEELSRRFNLDFANAKYITPNELREEFLLKSGLNDLLAERRNECFIVTSNDECTVYSGDDLERIRLIIEQETSLDIDVLSGVIASGGKARGRAVVCKSMDAIARVEKGDVIVAHMTRPEFVTSMKKACAIVTDEGGLTCHAAIVSRELGIPCIIGTKKATRAIRDGDMVDVDAEEGIVRIQRHTNTANGVLDGNNIKQKYQDYCRAKSPVMTLCPFIRSVVGAPDFFGIEHFKEVIYLNYDNAIHWHQLEEDNDRMGHQVLKKILGNPRCFNEYRDLFMHRFKSTVHSSERYRYMDLKKLPDKDLFKIYRLHSKPFFRFFGLAWQLDGIDAVNHDYLVKEISRLETDPDKVQEYASILSKYTRLSFTAEADLRILHAARAHVQGDYERFNRICADLEKKFYWVRNQWEKVSYISSYDFSQEARALAANPEEVTTQMAKIKADLERIVKAKQVVFRNLRDDRRVKHMTRLFDEFVAWHDLRKEAQMKAIYIWSRIYFELARRYNIDRELIQWAWIDELEKMTYTGYLDVELLKRRSSKYCCIAYNTHFEEYTGDEVDDIIRTKELLSVNLDGTEFKGISASPGKAKGRVLVSYDPAYLNQNLKPGEILLTSNTTPAFLPAMKRSGAIVTDEGGITCHAAIVARELGKPCVTGLKIASKLIKRGDLLDVDADRGFVRIVK